MALEIEYICQSCGHVSDPDNRSMVCDCGGYLKGVGCPGVTGTRDSFGVGKSFKDDDTGKEIDNWKSWEKAGYRNPLDTVKNHNVREGIKRKMDKIKKEKK